MQFALGASYRNGRILRHRVMSAGAAGPASANALDSEPATLDRPMLAQGFQRIFGTAWQVPAAGRQQRADGVLIKPYQQNQQAGEHFLAACSSARCKSPLLPGSLLPAATCGRTTRSSAGNAIAMCLKVSRMRRRMRLRSTAFGNSRLDTIMPSRGRPSSLGLAKT